MAWDQIGQLLVGGTVETLYTVAIATVLGYLLGLPLGVLLTITDRGGLLPRPVLNRVLGFVVNFLRSVPFLILMIWLTPFIRLVVGTSIGPKAAIVALVIAAAPFIARLVEATLKEVDPGVVEAARSMGAGNWQIITKVLLPEARTSLLINAAIATTTIIAYSAMAGFIGAGGLGTIATNYGYRRYNNTIMNLTVIVLVVLVQVIQELGLRLAKKWDKRKH